MMKIIDKFLDILSPLKIYSLDEESKIYAELSVFADEFDLIYDSLDEILRESFVFTACGYGLDSIESLYTAPFSELDPEERRGRIMNRLLTSDEDFTLSAMESALNAFGTEEYKITECVKDSRVIIEISGDCTEERKAYIKREITKIMPAGIVVWTLFYGISWQSFEDKNYTFSSMDSLNMTWEEIDEQKS